jgi:hypothetical protein
MSMKLARSCVIGIALSLSSGRVVAAPATPPPTTTPAADASASANATQLTPPKTETVAPAPSPKAEPLPDPTTWHQEPPPVLERPRPIAHVPKVEVGIDAGVVSRPSKGDLVHYGVGWGVGGHARVDLLKGLAARVHARIERNSVTLDDGALGLPSGTRYDAPSFQRVVLGFTLEPTWTPLPRLDVWLGLGLGWGRTTEGRLYASGAESVTLPIRSAVFVEFPASIGVRYQVIPRFIVVNLIGSASLVTNQSGGLEDVYATPGRSGLLVNVGAFPAFQTSFAALAGVGVLL